MSSIRNPSGLLIRVLLVTLVVVLTAPQKVTAQVLYGSVVGNVKDSTGAVVPKGNPRLMPLVKKPILAIAAVES